MFLFIDKPSGISSHGVVQRVRQVTHEKRVGHGGTLDPFATGLLIVGVGRESTKRLGELLNNTSKTYKATLHLGEERTTDDPEGEIINRNSEIVPSLSEVKEAFRAFTGKIVQTPPQFSAIKIAGKPAYASARKGKHVYLKPRNVIVHTLKLQSYKYPEVSIQTKVSSGTYIRVLARDIGRELETGAYLSSLRRTKIGEFDVKESVGLNELTTENVQSLMKDL